MMLKKKKKIVRLASQSWHKISFLPSQNLQQFTNPVEMFSFVDETQENIVDLFSNEGAKSQEFTVNTMKHSFKKVTFARIFRIKELQQLKV